MMMDKVISLGWWHLAGSMLSGRSVATDPEACKIHHEQVLHRRGNPHAKNQNQKQSKAKQKHMKRFLASL